MSVFTNLISPAFKQLHVDMITELIRGCSVTCTLSFGVTLYVSCANCIFDPIGNKSSNRYLSGGPAEFSTGMCPMCGGAGKIPDVQTETISLVPIFDYKGWIPGLTVASPDGFVQTLSVFSTFDILKRAKDIIIDTSIDLSVRPRFERHGEPEPCGIGTSDFVLTLWKRIENG